MPSVCDFTRAKKGFDLSDAARDYLLVVFSVLLISMPEAESRIDTCWSDKARD